MDALKTEIIKFTESLSGMSDYEKCLREEEERRKRESEEEKKEENKEFFPIDYRPLLSDPYRGKWQNEWVMQVYESALNILRALRQDNMTIMEQRFKRLKQDYYSLRNKPKTTTSGLNSQYERAFNKRYYF